MKVKYYFLAAMLAISGIVTAIFGVVIKYAILEPRGLERQESVVALPFVLLRDEGLRYVISDLNGAEEALPPAQTEPPVQTQPPATQPEPVPTRPQQTEPKQDVLKRVLFIGDSRTCGLRDHARLTGGDYFCDVGMTVFNASKVKLSDENFRGKTLGQLLAEKEYTCVILSLGLNEAGYPINSLIRAYHGLLTEVVQTQPQALIVLQGVMNVTQDWANHTPYAAPENINAINQKIAALADGYHSFYIDPNPRFSDETGYLPDSMTADGCHLYAKYTHLWSDWICQRVKQIGEANGM